MLGGLWFPRHGPGTYHYSDTGAVYRGCWVNDQMESAGGYVYSNHRYEGNFVNNAVSAALTAFTESLPRFISYTRLPLQPEARIV